MDRLKELKNFILKDLLLAVIPDEVLEYKRSTFYVKGKPIETTDAQMLIDEAQALKRMTLLQLLFLEMKRISNERMFEKSQTTDDMVFGKALLYTIDILEKKIDNIAEIKLPKVVKEPKL